MTGARAERGSPLVPVLAWTAGTAAVLVIFDLLSARSDLARRGWLTGNGDRLARPPIYGQFSPHVTRWVLAAIAVAGVAGLLAWLAGSGRVPAVAFVAAASVVFFGFSLAVAFVAGDRVEAAAGMTAEPDASVVERLGVRRFVERYPELVGGEVRGVHSLTHPPGRPLIGWALGKAFGDAPLAKALAVAGLASIVTIPTWLLARERFGERGARYALALLVTAPGPALFAFASVEALEAVPLVAGGWLFCRALRDDGDPRWGGAAGAVLGLTMLFTYSAAIVAAFLAIYAVLTRPRRTLVRAFGGAVGGGALALAVLYLTLGFDPFAVSSATRRFNSALPPCPEPPPPGTGPCELQRSAGYWIFGAPAGWLTFAGVPIVALGVRAFFSGRWRYVVAIALPNLVLYLLPHDVTGLLPGELERTVLWAVPFAAASAGGAVARLGDRRGVRALAAGFALLAAGQAITIEVLYRNGW